MCKNSGQKHTVSWILSSSDFLHTRSLNTTVLPPNIKCIALAAIAGFVVERYLSVEK